LKISLPPHFFLQSIVVQSFRLYFDGLTVAETNVFCHRCQFNNMAKKNFVHARLVSGEKWYIDYTIQDASTGEVSRHRQSFDLDKIENLEIRLLVAERLVRYIHVFAGKVRVDAAPEKGPILRKALADALAVKCSSPRKNTHRGYKSIVKMFLEWCPDKLAMEPIGAFTRKNAIAYWDYLQTQGYRGVTLHNKLIHLRALWAETIRREWCEKNPWDKITPPKKEEKLRRIFTDDELAIVAREIEKQDYWMFRGVLLQYYCYIRPVELTRLKMRDFDFGAGTITVQEYNDKKWKKRIKTIPKSVLPYFIDGVFDKYPGNYYMYGLHDIGSNQFKIEPGPKKIGDNRMYQRHKKLLQRLKNDGVLQNIDGLVWYSWKDTGITKHSKLTTLRSTADQAGHSDIGTTMVYYHVPNINTEYRDLPNDLVP